MRKEYYIYIIIFLGLIFPSLIFADPQISKEIEKEWFLRDKNPDSMKRIRERGFDEGIANIEELSLSLVTEGYKLLKSDPAKAMTLFQTAIEFSPDYPPAYYALGKAYWKQSFLNIFKTLDEFLSGLKATLRNFWWFFLTVGNLSLTLVISILISILLFSILMLIRYLPLLKHDIKETLPRIPPVLFILILAGSILSYLILNPGFFYLYLVLLFLLWPYLSIKEKGIGLFTLLFMALLPLVIPFLLSFIFVHSSSGLKAIVEVNKGWVDNKAFIELEERVRNKPDDKEALFSLALTKKKKGDFTDALTIYKTLSEMKYLPDRIHNNIGNIHAARKNFNDAIESYKKALEKNPKLVSAHYNLSQIYRETFRFEEGEREYEEARKINPELLKTYSSQKGQSFNRLVVDEGLTKIEIWRSILRRSEENKYLSESVWNRFMKWVPLRRAPYIFLLLSIIFLIYGLINKRRSSVYSCVKCGIVVCRKCQTERYEDMCEKCYKILIRMEGSSQERIEKILEMRRFQDMKRGFLKLLSFLPGIGQLYEGKSIKGIVFLFFMTFLVSWWFFWDYLKIPYKFYPSYIGPARLSFILFTLILYFLFLKDRKRLSR